MRLREALTAAASRLAEVSDTSRLDAELLAAHLLDLRADPDQLLDVVADRFRLQGTEKARVVEAIEVIMTAGDADEGADDHADLGRQADGRSRPDAPARPGSPPRASLQR